jgi:hypothetical protein
VVDAWGRAFGEFGGAVVELMWVSLLAEVPQVVHQVLKTLRIVRETIMRKTTMRVATAMRVSRW